jgi:hypothetical protein
MRTSNKILLGLLLTSILVFTSLFAAVRIKYANGDIVTAKEGMNNTWSNAHSIKEPLKSVRIEGMSNVIIIPADSASLEIWKDGPGVQWKVKDGVLDIINPDLAVKENGKILTKSWTNVVLFLPKMDSIAAIYSEVTVRNSADSGRLSPSFNLYMNYSELAIENGGLDDKPVFYDKLKVDARNNSALRIRRNVHVNELEARFIGARFEEDNTEFGKLSIQTDSSSEISIKGKNLRKATITSTE